MTAFITGLGWVTSRGPGSGRNKNGFVMEHGTLPKITRKDVFDRPTPHFGRMDAFSRLGLCAISLALKDACLKGWSEKRDMGVIAASTWGCLKTDADYYQTVLNHGGAMASPALFSYTLPNCFLGEAAVSFGLSGTGFVINDPSPRGLVSIKAGVFSIFSGESEKMICGLCDLEPPVKMPRSKAALTGAVFLVMEKSPQAAKDPYGELWLDRKGTLYLNHQETKNIQTLVNTCLSSRATGSKDQPA